MAEAQAPAAAPKEKNHAARIFGIWIVLAVISDVLIWAFWRPHMPPGTMSDQARGQGFDIAVMAVIGAPVLVGVLTYFCYTFVVWRQRPGDTEDGPAIHGNTPIQATWIVLTAAIVLFLAGFGTYELIKPAGAGSGEGPVAIWQPTGDITTTAWSPGAHHTLVVQAIGQQWTWTYRYPQFGGMESTQLMLPIDTPVEFHVTSLDVIHSFWAYDLGVKADANPGVDNVAFVTPLELGSFSVRCNELCGIWHGAMYNYGHVVTSSQFESWASALQNRETSDGLIGGPHPALPPYALSYDPTVIPQLGKDLTDPNINGITGANGYYYPGPQSGTPGDPVSP